MTANSLQSLTQKSLRPTTQLLPCVQSSLAPLALSPREIVASSRCVCLRSVRVARDFSFCSGCGRAEGCSSSEAGGNYSSGRSAREARRDRFARYITVTIIHSYKVCFSRCRSIYHAYNAIGKRRTVSQSSPRLFQLGLRLFRYLRHSPAMARLCLIGANG